MIQREQQLTPEELEALPGFAASTPRRVRQKRGQTQKGFLADIGCVVAFLVILLGFGAFGIFVPTLRISLAIGGGVFLVLLSLLILFTLPQTLFQRQKHWRLARYGVATVARVRAREIHVDMGSQGPYGWTDYIATYEFQAKVGGEITGTLTSRDDNYQENGPILIVYNPMNPKEHQAFLSLIYEPLA